MAKRFNLFVTEDYEANGEKKTSYHQVGSVFFHDKGEGMNIKIIPGVSVSGTLVAFPPKEKSSS